MKFKISEIAQVVGGGTPSTKEEDNYANSGVAWITPKDLSGYTQKYIANGSRDISEKGLNSSSAKLMPKGTVLVSSRAPIGYVAIADGPLATNQGFKSLVPNKDVVTSEYLYYVMKQSKSALEQVATGTTFKEVSGSVMKNFEIDIPNLDEQERVVSILAPIDQKIELLQTINDNLAAVVEMIFQKMLLTQTAEETIPLSKLFITKSGYAFKSKDWSETGSSVVKIKDINGKTIDTGGLSCVENVEALTKASKFYVSGGETVIALTGATTGKIGVVPNKLDAYINQRVGLTTPSNSDIHRSLIWSVFLQSDVINGLIGLADGSAQANLSPTDINNFEIAISTQRISEFQIIADPLFEAYIANLSEISILGNMRNELLTELLS